MGNLDLSEVVYGRKKTDRVLKGLNPKNSHGYKPYGPRMGWGGFEPDADIPARSLRSLRGL
jgi:hypothetical protein